MQRNLLLILFVGIALGLGYWLGQRNEGAPPIAALASSNQVYVCPMHPHITQGHPDGCPICGMDLVATQQAANTAQHQNHVDTATQAKLGVRLATAEHTALSQDIATYATLVADESAVQRITANVDGVLTKLHVSCVGQRIARGEEIYEISSQDISNLQYDYLDIQQRAGPARQMAEEGDGADVMKRIATPLVGGMISAPLISLFLIHAMYAAWLKRTQRLMGIKNTYSFPRKRLALYY